MNGNSGGVETGDCRRVSLSDQRQRDILMQIIARLMVHNFRSVTFVSGIKFMATPVSAVVCSTHPRFLSMSLTRPHSFTLLIPYRSLASANKSTELSHSINKIIILDQLQFLTTHRFVRNFN